MPKLSTKKPAVTARTLVFGPPKSGKTLAVGKLAEHFDLLWFDLENGHETLFQLPMAYQERIELLHIPDSSSFPIAAETMLKVIKGAPCNICEIHGKVSCMLCKKAGAMMTMVQLNSLLPEDTIVVVDSMSQLTASFIANICKGENDDYKMKTDDWGHLGKLVEIFLSNVQVAGYKIVVISHEVEAVTEGKKNKLVPVAGSRNSSRNAAKYFDNIVYMEIKNKKHRSSSGTTAEMNILTGTRSGVAIEDYDDSSLLRIFKPELFPEVETKPTTKGAATANSVLARLSNKK